MRDEVARDLSDSAYDFLRVVWPAIKPFMQHGELKPVEAIASEELKGDLDKLAGIDAWHIVYERRLMRGIASRVQWISLESEPWRSFTIRMERPNGVKTEFEKRCEAIDRMDEGWLFPHLTVQGYVAKPRRSGQLLAAAIVRTKDLYNYARKHPEREWRRNPEDGVWFTPWWWDELKRAGIQVRVIEPPERTPIYDELVRAAKRKDYNLWEGIDANPPDWTED